MVGYCLRDVCGKNGDRGGNTEIGRIYFIDRTSWWDMWCSDFLSLTVEFMAPLCWRLKEANPSMHSSAFNLFLIWPVHLLRHQAVRIWGWWVGGRGGTVRFIVHAPIRLEKQYLQPNGNLRYETPSPPEKSFYCCSCSFFSFPLSLKLSFWQD